MVDVTEWYNAVEQMVEIAQREETWYFVMFDWEWDECVAAQEVLLERLGRYMSVYPKELRSHKILRL